MVEIFVVVEYLDTEGEFLELMGSTRQRVVNGELKEGARAL